MSIAIHPPARTIGRAHADQMLQARKDVALISCDPAPVADLTNSTACVRHLWPWGSMGAYWWSTSPRALRRQDGHPQGMRFQATR